MTDRLAALEPPPEPTHPEPHAADTVVPADPYRTAVGPPTSTGLSTVGASMDGSDRRTARRSRPRVSKAAAPVEDPTRAAARRNGKGQARLSQLALTCSTTRAPDAARIDKIIDARRANGRRD